MLPFSCLFNPFIFFHQIRNSDFQLSDCSVIFKTIVAEKKFFNLRHFGLALVWLLALWALIIWMIGAFHPVDAPAAWLQLPYLLWVTFAAYLNLGTWMLNR